MAVPNRITPERDLREILLRVRTPGRYVGGELGAVRKAGEDHLDVAVSYPDLYDVGMSNLGLRILYQRLNALPGVRCERVFAAAPDFEAELRAARVPLYTLETGIPLSELNLIGFSLGTELALTNLLQILDLGGVPIRREDREAGRGDTGPVVLAGGPAATNPVPFGRFVDAVFVGEAEEWVERVFADLARRKSEGAGRRELLARLAEDPAVWTPEGGRRVKRALWAGFGAPVTGGATAARSSAPPGPGFPVSSIRLVQDEGAVEIMRGCPRGCRFCHATVFYRPYRVKTPPQIISDIERLVHGGGYSEITLASLSTGDYPGLRGLVDYLGKRYSPLGVSFSLPSLRVSSVDLQLMTDISEVRKSGLTFAVETARPENQRAVNKVVPPERILEILLEARAKGWNKAKLYFMVGLPQAVVSDEANDIVDLVKMLRGKTHMEIRLNLGTFVPKAHTPFQDAPMLDEVEANRRIHSIKHGVGRGVHVGWQEPFLSLVEALVARGDTRAADLVEEAYRRGARLDAWHEHHREEIWREVFAAAGWDVEAWVTAARDPAVERPWDVLSLGVGRGWVAQERARAAAAETSCACGPECGEPCGACGPGSGVREQGWTEGSAAEVPALETGAPAGPTTRFVFSFRKEGKAVFLSHLNLVNVLARSFRRAGLRTRLTEGYNPKPRMEVACPLSLGMVGESELAAVELYDPPTAAQILERVNAVLPEGLSLTGCGSVPPPPPRTRPRSLAADVWGAAYVVEGAPLWLVEALTAGGSPLITAVQQAGADLSFRHHAESTGLPKLLIALTGRDPLVEGLRIRRVCLLKLGPEGEPVAMTPPG